MKKSKLFLFGLLTAILAEALVLAGCDSAVGDGKGERGEDGTSTTLLNEAELAAYGYSYAAAVRKTLGRAPVLLSAITGTLDITTVAPSLTGGAILVTYDGQSVQYTLPASTLASGTIDALTDAVAEIGLSGELVDGKFLKISAPTTGELKTLTIAGVTADLQQLFYAHAGSSITNALDSGEAAIWEYSLHPDSQAAASVASQISWGRNFIPVPEGKTLTAHLTTNVDFLTSDEWMISTASSKLTFTAKEKGPKAAPARPVVESNANLLNFGYTFARVHTTPGTAQIGTGSPVAATDATVASSLTKTSSTGVMTAGDKVVIEYNGKKNVTIIPATKAVGWGSSSQVVITSDISITARPVLRMRSPATNLPLQRQAVVSSKFLLRAI